MHGRATMGERLQQLRQTAGLSQNELAKAAGVPLGTIRNWEQDRRSPLLLTAIRVARTLGVSLDELAKDVELPKPGRAAKTQKPRKGAQKK